MAEARELTQWLMGSRLSAGLFPKLLQTQSHGLEPFMTSVLWVPKDPDSWLCSWVPERPPVS